MSADGQKTLQLGAVLFGLVTLASVIMLGALAIVHDGELANQITGVLLGTLQTALPSLGALLGLDRLVTGYVQVKQATAAAPASVAATVPPQGVPSEG